MNELMTSGVLTMDSREIAEMTGKNHADVCRDIRNMIEPLGIDQSRIASVYKAGNGEERRCFKLPKRETLILVSGYSVELRAAIIDRWAELEASNGMSLPKTFADALQLAANQAREIEAQAKQLEAQAPKVAFYDQVTGSKDTTDIGVVAKVLNIKGIGRNNLFELLRQQKILMDDNQPYQKYQDSGHFRIVEVKYQKPDGSTNIYFKTVVYQKGIDMIRKLIEKAKS